MQPQQSTRWTTAYAPLFVAQMGRAQSKPHMTVAEGCAMVDELTADEIRTLLRLEPHATCGSVRISYLSSQSIAAGGLPPPFSAPRPMGSQEGSLALPTRLRAASDSAMRDFTGRDFRDTPHRVHRRSDLAFLRYAKHRDPSPTTSGERNGFHGPVTHRRPQRRPPRQRSHFPPTPSRNSSFAALAPACVLAWAAIRVRSGHGPTRRRNT